MDPAPTLSATAAPGSPQRLHWRSLSDGLLISYVVGGPTIFASLILHDQKESGWSAPLILAGLGFVIGGAVAGRHRRTPKGAFYQGAALGLLTATVILFADVIRRLVLSKGVHAHTVAVLVGIEVGSIVAATVGALIGRWWYLRTRRRKAAGLR
jgi:hypothetical protein